ncbi:death domain-containing membrane protein NRADD-like isoform X2 [Melanerpes formicivorus]|uniref:death domain-containing membrane protein NRADD-like isoform X2 n=1 Tax=Melanerpes formicivorus TaxID=211600 RepID=UPI00358ED8BD
MEKRPALPCPRRATPPALRGRAERSRVEPNRSGASRARPSGTEPDREEPDGSEAAGSGLGVLGAAAAAARPDQDLEHMDEQLVTGDPSSVTPQFVAPPEAAGKDIIPVYCSLLAAVVVGLLAYVAFKWQKQQLAKARAGDVGTAAEGEKLHSDSGVCLDTHSLQEPHQPGKAPRPEGHPLSGLSAQRQEEVEQLLEAGGAGGDWRSLAASLGFSPDAIGTFGRGRAPARTLLSAWAASEGATVDALCQALAAIGRQDVAQRLVAPGDATSVV